jgi:hypothetical protein
MSKNQKKKRQHYVPRFLLRNFSADKRRIATYLLATRTRIDEASLRAQCYSDYFYGRDQRLEDSFSGEESKISLMLGDLDPGRLEQLAPEALYQLRQFVHYQRQRTLGAAIGLDSMAEALLKNIASKSVSLTQAEIDRVRIRLQDPQSLALWSAATSTPLLFDLYLKFLIAEHPVGFVISDHPVASYNQFAEHHPKFRHYGGTTGLALKGLQMFLPVSPSVCIAIFDPATYCYGSPKSRVCSPSARDVAFLNAMQAVNAVSCIYFDPRRMDDEHLAALAESRQGHADIRKTSVWNGPLTVRPDGHLRQMVATTAPDIRLGRKLSFVRVIDTDRYRNYDRAILPVRSPKLVKLAESYERYVDNLVQKRRRERQSEGPTIKEPD